MMLSPDHPQPALPRLRPVRTILVLTADRFGIEAAALLGPVRRRSLSRPRHLAMLLCRDVAGLSASDIGRAMDRDHATVLNGWRRARAWIEDDPVAADHAAILRHRAEAVLAAPDPTIDDFRRRWAVLGETIERGLSTDPARAWDVLRVATQAADGLVASETSR